MDKLGELFHTSLKFMDTKKDRDTLKALMAHATSASFVTKLQGIKNRTAIMHCKAQLATNLNIYRQIEITSLTARNDMTNVQQHCLHRRTVNRRKQAEFKTRHEKRGRMLKSEQFPELTTVMEFVFDELDRSEGGGGLEAHPRLTTDTLFLPADSCTFMKHAREAILRAAPPGFTISLSSCYNYTQNYRENSAGAKRHHHGMGINTNISLKKPSRTGVQKQVFIFMLLTQSLAISRRNHLSRNA